MENDNTLRWDGRILLLIALVLTVIGFVFIYSSSSVYALEQFGSAHYFLKKQLFAFIPAIVAFILFAAFVPVSFLRRYAPFLFIFSFVLTLLSFLPGVGQEIHGSHRWLRIFGFSIQPSEFLKLFFILYMGFFIERKREQVRSLIYGYIPFLVILGATSLLLLKQPDFGSVVTLLLSAFIMLFVADFKIMHLLITLATILPIGVTLIFSRAYRLNRILIFLNPWADRQGKGFQIIQSLIAIGSGGLWGMGISNSKQKFFYLPMQHTDFIFSIIAEETGFVGSMVLILLFVLFAFFGVRVAMRLQDMFMMFTALGFIMLISVQAVVNLMVTTGLLPTKGLGLPFVSYGGTSLICLWLMMGIITNFIRSEKAK